MHTCAREHKIYKNRESRLSVTEYKVVGHNKNYYNHEEDSVSFNNGVIDWSKVAKDTNIGFVYY